MSPKIIGIEGRAPADEPVHWGTPAIQIDDATVLNPVSGRRIPHKAYLDLVVDGVVTHLPAPLFVDPSTLGSDPVLLVVRRSHTAPATVRPAATHCSSRVTTGDVDTFLFRTAEAFHLFAADCAQSILALVCRSSQEPDTHRLLKLAFTLAPRDPDVNALRTMLGDTPLRLALASVDPARIARFQRLITAFKLRKERYKFKYRGGVALHGGMSLSRLHKTTGYMDDLLEASRRSVQHDFRFLNDFSPDVHVPALKAASAELELTPAAVLPDEDDPEDVGDELLRVLEIMVFERLLRDGAVPGMALNERSQTALAELLRPTDATQTEQTPLGATNPEPLTGATVADKASVKTPPMSVLCFAQGIPSKSRQLTLRLSPSLCIKVSLDTNGEGQIPVGAEDVLSHTSAYTFTPLLAAVVREQKRHGKTKFHLLGIRRFDVGGNVRVTAAPSTVVPWSFFESTFEVTRDAYGIHAGSAIFAVGGADLVHQSQWVAEWSAHVRHIELAAIDIPTEHWHPTTREIRPTVVVRLLHLMQGGGLSVDDLTRLYHRRFGTYLDFRSMNVALSEQEDLFEVDLAGDRIATTAKGNAFLRIWHAAGARDPSEGARPDEK
jgi:hypothetical protein